MQLSFVCDGVLEKVQPEHDALIYVESDLIWEPAPMIKLLGWLSRVDAVSPMVMRQGHDSFWDTWGYRKDGVKFQHKSPHHPLFAKPPQDGLYGLDSIGSCIVLRGEVARECRFRPPTHAIWGFCEDIQRHGYKIWLDPSMTIFHE
jgi:hypothetical protein